MVAIFNFLSTSGVMMIKPATEMKMEMKDQRRCHRKMIKDSYLMSENAIFTSRKERVR